MNLYPWLVRAHVGSPLVLASAGEPRYSIDDNAYEFSDEDGIVAIFPASSIVSICRLDGDDD